MAAVTQQPPNLHKPDQQPAPVAALLQHDNIEHQPSQIDINSCMNKCCGCHMVCSCRTDHVAAWLLPGYCPLLLPIHLAAASTIHPQSPSVLWPGVQLQTTSWQPQQLLQGQQVSQQASYDSAACNSVCHTDTAPLAQRVTTIAVACWNCCYLVSTEGAGHVPCHSELRPFAICIGSNKTCVCCCVSPLAAMSAPECVQAGAREEIETG